MRLPVSELKNWHTPAGRYVVAEGEWYLWLGSSSGVDAEIMGAKIRISGQWEAPLSAVTLRCEKRILAPGESAALKPTATLMDASRISTEDAAFVSTDESVLRCENGLVTAVGPGLCSVRMTISRGGVTKQCCLPFLVQA